MRLVGSSACVSSWVASGKIDAIINLRPTETLGSTAGRLFITEAGGMVSNINGHKRKTKDTLLCSNGLIHNDIIKFIKDNDLDK